MTTFRKISELPTAGSIDDSTVIPVVRSGVTQKVAASTLANYLGSKGFGTGTGNGFTGSAGSPGFTGSAGSQGFTGSAGAGFTGSAGSPGFTGSAGSPGGFTGSQGFTGSKGDPAGFTGSEGFTGSRGFTGSEGFTGSRGFTGSAGFTGSVGFTGSAPANMMTTNTAQTVTGRKSFDTGKLAVNDSANIADPRWGMYSQANGPYPALTVYDGNTSGASCIGFLANGGNPHNYCLFYEGLVESPPYTPAGAIVGSGPSVSYLSASDYRLKTNVESMVNAIDRLKLLAPKRFNWTSSPDAPKIDGFIAHEVQSVVPQAVNGVKDAVMPNGDINPQGMDNAKLVPLLTAALQEAIARIEALEARLN